MRYTKNGFFFGTLFGYRETTKEKERKTGFSLCCCTAYCTDFVLYVWSFLSNQTVFKVLFCFSFLVIGLGVDDLYPELWKLCAGPLVEIPHVQERVFYFPQGHIEQVINLKIYLFS